MAAQVVIKPAYITHRRLYLAEEGRNYPDAVQFMAAVKDAYLEKMINSNEELSFQSFCVQCFRCFPAPFDLQVHRELVHQSQHAATCRICEFNFGDPSFLLKHMAAVHSAESPPAGLLGAYRCLICRFCSPLYSELVRHYNEYHSRSGWLLCPLCLRVFSSDTTYEQHMAQHIQKGKYFRCQSCRLVFESESFRARHELEMHGRQKWAVPEFYPKVPKNVKVWVRGEIDSRSKVLSIEEVDEEHACRALCLNDCTDPENSRKSREAKREHQKTKGQTIFVPQDQLVAPKAFKEEILFGKTRSQRRSEPIDPGPALYPDPSEAIRPISLFSDIEPTSANRKNTLLNHISELFFLLDDEAILNSGTTTPEPVKQLALMSNEDQDDGEKEKLSTSEIPIVSDEKAAENDEEKEILDPQEEPNESTKAPETFKPQKCYECDSVLASNEDLLNHYTNAPLKYYRGNFETHCAVAFERYKQQFVNGPSLQAVHIKESWTAIGRNLLSSYPKGAQCVCGKVDWDFGNTNSIAKHLIYNPSHYVKIAESASHRESVKNKLHSQRIRRLIQSGHNQHEQKIDRSSYCPPIAKAKLKSPDTETSEEKPLAITAGGDSTDGDDSISKSIRALLKVRKRVNVADIVPKYVNEPTNRRRFRISASGVDLEGNIISRVEDLSTVSRKDERRITSVLHKANVERQARMQQLNQQQQIQQQVLQHLRTENDRRSTPNGNIRKIQPQSTYQTQSAANRLDAANLSMQRKLIGQKRTSTQAAQPVRKMTTSMMQYRQKILPVPPADVKFPVVTHKEIQVEIVPSEDARHKNNIDKYEIEFKGRKTPNKYNVKPNIKIVKLIGLQSDTEYLIKVFAIRNNIRSEPIMKRVKTTPLPRGSNTAVVSDVIELD